MTVLRPATIARLQTLTASLFADSYALLRQSLVPDGEGGTTTTEATVETGACLLVPLGTGPEAEVAGRLQLRQPLRALLPPASVVTSADRLQVGSRTFGVRGVMRPGAACVYTDVLLEEGA